MSHPEGPEQDHELTVGEVQVDQLWLDGAAHLMVSSVSSVWPMDVATGTLVPPDLTTIGAQLADVAVALERLDAGTYWTCEVSGCALDDAFLAADPVARRRQADC